MSITKWFSNTYQDYEVGAGRINPGSLGQRLSTAGLRWVPSYGGSSFERWIGAAALTLVILSWWQGLPIQRVAAWIVGLIVSSVN